MTNVASLDQSHQTDTPLPLADIRVLELCHTVMGPSCGMVLADMGAEVVKIEPAPNGDRTRSLNGFQVGTFSYYNRNKKSIGINLKTEAGRAVLHKLVSRSDVLIENYGPGTAERLGMGYEELSAINPRLIYCSLKGYLPGPYGHRAALDEVVQYQVGLAHMTGYPGKPLRAGASIIDITGGVFGAVAILAALRDRDRTGRGQLVQSSLFESAAFLVGQTMAGKAVTGIEPPPFPVKKSAWAIYETFAAADEKRFFLGLTSNNHWKTFCETFDRADLFEDPRFATNETRLAAHVELRGIIQEIVREHDVDHLIDLLGNKGVPIAPVATPFDLFEDEHLNKTGGLAQTRLTNGVETKLPLLPMQLDGRRLGLYRDPPQAGEHSQEILQELGFSDEDFDSLKEQHAII